MEQKPPQRCGCKPVHVIRLRRKLLYAALTFSAVLAVFVAGGEVVLRSLAPESDSVKLGMRLPGSARRYGLRPNTRCTKTGVPVAINSLGFREKVYPTAKPPGVRRIIVLGDSYAFGVGVEFAHTFSKSLEDRLNELTGRFEVINFGVSGYGTTEELATLREVAGKFEPDVVIVAYVLNDAEPTAGPPDGKPPAAPTGDARASFSRAHIWLKDTSCLYRFLSPKAGALLGAFNARYAVGRTQEIMHSFRESSPGWKISRRALSDIATESRNLGAECLVCVFPMMLEFDTYPLRDAHQRIVRFCRDNGVYVFDLLPQLDGESASQLTVFLDGHPNARAHEIFAEKIFDYLIATTFTADGDRPRAPEGRG